MQGAAPPAVLWATVQEPIAAWARPRIRAAEASLRSRHGGSSSREGNSTGSASSAGLEVALLESVLEHTQVNVLLDEMDAIDDARRVSSL